MEQILIIIALGALITALTAEQIEFLILEWKIIITGLRLNNLINKEKKCKWSGKVERVESWVEPPDDKDDLEKCCASKLTDYKTNHDLDEIITVNDLITRLKEYNGENKIIIKMIKFIGYSMTETNYDVDLVIDDDKNTTINH